MSTIPKDTQEIRIGVFVCEWGINIAEILDCKELAKFCKTLPNVKMASDYLSMCTAAGADFIKQNVEEHQLNRIVVASCTPITHEPVFQAVLQDIGLDKGYLEFVNLREHCSFVHRQDKNTAMDMAKDMLRAGISRARTLEEIPERVVDITDAVLVIGGGVAGLQSALDLGNQGYKVYLVEEKATIGGKMAMLDRTFPTDDCSIWILGPLMLEADRNENIEIYSYSELTYVDGYVGNFEIEITQHPRYTTDKCNGCGHCCDVCPATTASEFNQGMNARTAIYVAFSQAVPMVAQIDMDACIKCGNCAKACDFDAVDYDQTETKITKKVGAIIVATGWDEYVPEIGYLGYGVYENVITQVTFERLIAPNGPVVGHLVRPSDNKPPKSILFVNCVGSRDINRNIYCSSGVCCMVSIKNAKLAKSHDPEMNVVISYIDIRAAGKGYEEYYLEARKAGVEFMRTKVVSIEEDPDTKSLKVVLEDSLDPKHEIKIWEFDMVVLSTSMIPSKSLPKLVNMLGLQLSSDGFLKDFHARLNTVDTAIPGISLAGVCHGPKSIAETIMQAKGAASSAGILLNVGKYRIDLIRAISDAEKCARCGMCASVCPFSAIKVTEETGAVVDEILCRGCGLCASVCPSGAITVRYYRDKQYNELIDNLLGDLTSLVD